VIKIYPGVSVCFKPRGKPRWERERQDGPLVVMFDVGSSRVGCFVCFTFVVYFYYFFHVDSFRVGKFFRICFAFVSFALVVRLFRACFAFFYLSGVGSFRVCLFVWRWFVSRLFISLAFADHFEVLFISMVLVLRWLLRLFHVSLFILRCLVRFASVFF